MLVNLAYFAANSNSSYYKFIQMAQKPVPWGEVGARALRVRSVSREAHLALFFYIFYWFLLLSAPRLAALGGAGGGREERHVGGAEGRGVQFRRSHVDFLGRTQS